MNQPSQTAATMGTAWKGDTSPAVIAQVFSHAAALIDRHGYSGFVKSRVPGEKMSLVVALEAAARDIYEIHESTVAPYVMDHRQLADDATTRMGGLLLLTGQGEQCTLLPSVVDGWDDDYTHTKADALHMLGLAAFTTTMLAVTSA